MDVKENHGWITDKNGTRRVNPIEKYSYLVGTKINKWEVLKIENNRRHPDAICKCECGTIKAVNIRNLINNCTKDCGCGRKQMLSAKLAKNLVGQKFGRLTVVEMLGSNKHKKQMCKCMCDCGNEVVVVSSSLSSKHTLSCGCLVSYYNLYIKDYLDSIKVEHQTEYTVKIEDSYYRFDFYLSEYNLFIEYDGSQHYEVPRYYGDNDEKNQALLAETQLHDKIKNEYCRSHNINLLRIPYWESKNIKTIINNHLQRLSEKGSNNLEYAIV